MTTPIEPGRLIDEAEKHWETVARLAHELLGDAAPVPRDLSKIEKTIIPEHGKRQAKTFTSFAAPLEDIEVLPEYDFALRALQVGCPSIFVTGKAGTGKSTLIQWLCQKLEDCAVVAPTAIAAVNVQGDTIHSMFGLPPRHIDPDEDFHPKAKVRLLLENIKFLIVDEVSMVLPNMVDAMSNILKGVRRNTLPFGGVPTIFIGDLLQLPPVVSSQEEAVYFSHRYRTHHFFSADVFKDQKIVPINLTVVRRQSDKEFIEALNHIRLNDNCREHVAMLNRRCFRDKLDGAIIGIYLVPTNLAAKKINIRELDSLPGELQVYEATITGHLPANKWKLPVPDRLELKVGAKIIFLKNNKPQWINGDLGEVVGLAQDHIRIKKYASDNVLIVGKETWHKYKFVYDYDTQKIEREEVGTFNQFPVALGWAITIHKSQGMTLENLTLDLGSGAFCEGQTYVALSRAKTIEGITLATPISLNDVKVDRAVLDFYRQLGIEQ
jgi:energy-coupling factor transporter ATP-binding protein EcfA2